MKKFYLIYVLFATLAINAQNDVKPVPAKGTTDDNQIYNTAGLDVVPAFPGGVAAFQTHINKKFNERNVTPETNDIRVYAQFVVEKDGTLSDINILRSPDKAIGDELVRIITTSPKWVPGSLNGKIVRVRYNVPMTIKRTKPKDKVEAFDDNVAVPDFNSKKVEDTENKVYIMPNLDEKPTFPGGTDAFLKLFDKNFDKSKLSFSSYALADIIVEKDGSLTVTVSKATNDTVKAETERVLKSLPKWTPAKIGGQPVRTTFSQRFEIRKQ